MQNSTIQIVKSQKTNAFVTKFQNSVDFGYIIMKAETILAVNNCLQKRVRSTIFKGNIHLLNEYVTNAQPSLQVEGRIIVSEFKESEIPVRFLRYFVNQKMDIAEALKPFAKRAGKEADAPFCIKDNEIIYRFTEFSTTDTDRDTLCAHDNIEQIVMFRKEHPQEASLPIEHNEDLAGVEAENVKIDKTVIKKK